MQELAKRVANEAEQFDSASSVDVDELTAKQIADIDRALKGQAPEPKTDDKSGEKSVKSEAAPEKVDEEVTPNGKALSEAVSEEKKKEAVLTAAVAETTQKKRTLKELPANLSAETGAALKRFDSLLNGSAKLRKRAPQSKTNDQAPETAEKNAGEKTSAKVLETTPAISPEIGVPDVAPSPSTADRARSKAESPDPKVDFFTLRRSLRQLQFNYSINKPHDDSIKEEFDDLLANFSRMSVQYQQMGEDHAKSMEDRQHLARTQNELLDAQGELQKANQAAKNADLRRTKDLEAFAQLTARQNAARAEVKEAQESAEALKREMAERSQEYESKNEENLRLAHEVSLAEAEKGVLRESLSEACDKIAELLSGEHRFESMIQELEDEVAHLKAVVSTRQD